MARPAPPGRRAIGAAGDGNIKRHLMRFDATICEKPLDRELPECARRAGVGASVRVCIVHPCMRACVRALSCVYGRNRNSSAFFDWRSFDRPISETIGEDLRSRLTTWFRFGLRLPVP